jgi:Na+-transporting methylmalonyl-CoA/oxaloacetate decarboxylase gamma subunit
MIKKFLFIIILLLITFFSGYFIGKYKPDLIFKSDKTVNTAKSVEQQKQVKQKTDTKKTNSDENDIIKDVIQQSK